MSLYVGNKKYCIVQKVGINNQDITITENGNYTADEEYSGFGLVRVNVPQLILETATLEPTVEDKTYYPLNDGFSEVTVKAVTADIDENIVAENIKKDVTILGVTGTFEYILEDITIDPTIREQVFVSEEDGYAQITVNPVTASIDENILAENIRKGVIILGVEGTLVETNETSRTITENGTYQADEPYSGFYEVIVDVKSNLTPLEIEPKMEVQVFDTESDYAGYNPVTVAAVTADIDENILAENIREGVTILGVEGTLIESVETTIEINGNGTFTPEEGYTGFSEVIVDVSEKLEELTIEPSIEEQILEADGEDLYGYSKITVNPVTAAIDENIIPENIKVGITILGVTGISAGGGGTIQNLLEIDDSGTYYPDEGYDGIEKVVIDLDWIEEALEKLNAGDSETDVLLQDITITEGGVYTADAGYDGLGTVTFDSTVYENEIASLQEYIDKLEKTLAEYQG